MKANWKLGLSRAWMVGSVLWIVLAVWMIEPFLYADFHSAPNRADFDAGLAKAKKEYQPTDAGWPDWMALDTSEGGAIPYVRFSPEADEIGKIKKDVHWTIDVAMTAQGTTTFSGVPYDEDPAKIYQAIKKFYDDRNWPQTEGDMVRAVAIVLGPPLGLLILGLALWWVGAGFRASQL